MSKKPKPPIALYSALADATRCRILEILRAGPLPVHVLTEAFAISRPAISRHLRVLKTAGLVTEVKKGRENLYAFKPGKLEAGKTWLETLSTTPGKPLDAVVEAAPVPAAREEVKAPKATKPTPKARKKLFADDSEAAAAPKPAPPPSANQMGFDF